MKQITILGAENLVGKILLQKAINKGIKVKVLVQNKEELKDFTQSIEVIEGSYFDKHKLQKALKNSQIILSTIDFDLHNNLTFEDEDKYINSIIFIIQQMKSNKQSRWISISSAGVKKEGENLSLARKILRVKLMTISKSIINVRERELHLLEKSNLDYTIVRCPIIKEKVEGTFIANDHNFAGNTVDTNQLSNFMFNEITTRNWLKSAPVVGIK